MLKVSDLAYGGARVRISTLVRLFLGAIPRLVTCLEHTPAPGEVGGYMSSGGQITDQKLLQWIRGPFHQAGNPEKLSLG